MAMSTESVNTILQAYRMRPVEDTTDAERLAFREAAVAALAEETQGIADAIKAVSPDLKNEVRNARIASILQLGSSALARRITIAAAPLTRRMDAAQALVTQAMNPAPKDPWDRGFWFSRACEYRRRIEGLNQKDRYAALKGLADTGDAALPAILQGPVPLVPEAMTPALVDAYLAKSAPDAVAVLEAGKEAQEEVQGMVSLVTVAVAAVAQSAGVTDVWNLLKLPTAQVVKGWPAATKTAFVGAKGEGAYAALLTGKADLSSVLTFFRPGL